MPNNKKAPAGEQGAIKKKHLYSDTNPTKTQEAQAYLEMLRCAAKGYEGKLILASYGENPKTGKALPPKVKAFLPSDFDKLMQHAREWAKEKHRNIYVMGALVRPDLPDNKKGGEKDVNYVLFIVCDFDAKDDPKAGEYLTRLPLPPDAVVETSPGSYQTIYVLKTPVSVKEIKPIIGSLINFVGCDSTCKDTSHVYRLPGFLNWPNQKKLQAGRSPEPFRSRFIKKWDGASGTDHNKLAAELMARGATMQPVPDKKKRQKAEVGTKASALNTTDTPAIQPIKRPLPEKAVEYVWREGKGDEDRSAVAFAAIKTYQDHGYSEEDIFTQFKAHAESAAAQHYISDEQLRSDITRSFKKAPEWVEKLNQTFFIVNENGKMMVYRWRSDEMMKREVLERIKYEDFKKMYSHSKVIVGYKENGHPIYRKLGEAWLDHPQSRRYLGGVQFAPNTPLPPEKYNLWRGFGVTSKQGNWQLMRDHIKNVICSNDEPLFQYVMGWLANCVQHPDRPGEVALVLQGGRGTGKGTFVQFFGIIFGQHYFYASSAKLLIGQFNAHLRDTVVCFADEAFFAADRQHESVLKSLITEPVIAVEGKYQNAVMAANLIHLIIASNESWIIPAGADERRFCVIQVADTHKQDKTYFAALYAQMNNGGMEAMLYDLLNFDLTNFDVRTVPQTEALAQQKLHSLTSVAAWLYERLHKGEIYSQVWDAGGLIIKKDCAHNDYVAFSKLQKEYRPFALSEFAKQLRKILGPDMKTDYRHPYGSQDRERHFNFASLGDCQRAFEKYYGIDSIKWETDHSDDDLC